MKKTIIITLILILMLYFAGCSIGTNFQSYDIDVDPSKIEKRDDGIWVYAPFYKTKSIKTIIPIIYDKEIYKTPYSCYFTIWGHFEKIQSVNARFILNGQNEIVLPVNIDQMNENRKNANDGRFIFPAGKFNLKIKWNEILQLELETKFIATSTNGKTKEYLIKTLYKKKLLRKSEIDSGFR